MYPPNLKSVALPVPEIRGGSYVANPNLEEGGHRGSGMVPFERALGSSYKPSIHIVPLSALGLSEILDCSFGWGCEPPILGKGRP